MRQRSHTDLNKATQTATEAHCTQLDKSGNPYILHPLAVMLRCVWVDEMIVAVLHDVIEDTTITKETLVAMGFEENIIAALVAISREKEEPYFNYIERCKKNYLATIVKIHDLHHNLSPARQQCLPDRESESLRKRYHKALTILGAIE